MCVRLSVHPTTVPRFNWLAEPAQTVGFRDLKPARTIGFYKLGQSNSETGNRPGQSDSANKKSPTKNRLCLLPRRAWKPKPGQSDSETGNRPGQSDSTNKKSPTKNRLCLLPRRAWKLRGGICNACILKDKFSLGPVHCPCWKVMTGVIEWEFSLSG